LPPPDPHAAPPGLIVERSGLPISIVEAVAMRQELENLIGRYESILIAANSADSDPDLEMAAPPTTAAIEEDEERQKDEDEEPVEPNLTASADDTIPVNGASIAANEILQTAQQKLEEFNQLVSERNYAAARDRWLEARDLLWENLPTDRPIAQSEVRAIWLDRGTIVAARSRDGLARIFDQLAAAGINTVFFETVNAGYPIYPSDVAPQPNPLTRRWDPLEAAVDLAHERGMELHAWVWTFAAGNHAHNRVVNLPIDYPGPVISAHPDWAGYDNRGNLILSGQEEPFLDPANPAVRGYLLDLFEEIITRYDVDGLQLDYIRYPFQNANAGRSFGYGVAARQQFQRITGVDPITLSPRGSDERSRQLWQQWTEFRIEQVNSFVADTSDLIHRLRPNVVLSTAVFALPEPDRLQKIQQSWETWARAGEVDMIVLMTYAADTHRLQQLAAPWLSENANLGSTIILPGIRILNLSDAAVFDQIQALRDLPTEGYAIFATAHLQETLQAILTRTQGTGGADPIPYRQPFDAALNRFTALRREWSFCSAKINSGFGVKTWRHGELKLKPWKTH
ncbi:MAG: family 10 glycosylhydrolase, partial [Cyanobacteria bacterium CRU_2_1]|nr:family 10 glycosylhydrolase [Cyanobacteria bacterium CRU_2_1]